MFVGREMVNITVDLGTIAQAGYKQGKNELVIGSRLYFEAGWYSEWKSSSFDIYAESFIGSRNVRMVWGTAKKSKVCLIGSSMYVSLVI